MRKLKLFLVEFKCKQYREYSFVVAGISKYTRLRKEALNIVYSLARKLKGEC